MSGKIKIENGPVEFEDAISKTGFGRYNITQLVVCGVSLMSVIMETLSMSFVLPAAQCDLQLSLTDKGLLSSVGFLGVVLSSLLWGFIGDVVGRRNVVIVTTYISFFTGILSSLVPYVWMLILLRFLNCFFIGGPSAVVIAYLGEFQDTKHRARVITLSATFVAVASMIIAALPWAVLQMEWAYYIPLLNIDWKPWRLLIILYGLPGFISATALLFLPESPKFLWSVGRSDEALNILKRMYEVNTGESQDMYPVKELVQYNENAAAIVKPVSFKQNNLFDSFVKLLQTQIVPIFRSPLLIRTFMTSFLQFGVFAGSSGMLMWYPAMLNQVSAFLAETNSTSVTVCQAMAYKTQAIESVSYNMTAGEDCDDSIDTGVFAISIIVGAAFALTYIFIGCTISYTGKKRLLAGLLIVTGTAGIITHFMPTFMLISILSGLFIVGGAGVTILNTAVVDLFPTQYRSIAMAVSLMVGRTGAMLASQFIGYLLEYSCNALFFLFGGSYIVLGFLALLLPSS